MSHMGLTGVQAGRILGGSIIGGIFGYNKPKITCKQGDEILMYRKVEGAFQGVFFGFFAGLAYPISIPAIGFGYYLITQDYF